MSEADLQGSNTGGVEFDSSGEIDTGSEPNFETLVNRQTRKEFFIKEISVYVLQIYLFFWVAFLFSACMTNEDQLSDYVSTVITDKLLRTMLYTVVASIITIGTIELFAKGVTSTSFIKYVSDEVAISIARAMYTIGSTLSGTCLAVMIYLLCNSVPSSNLELAIRYGWLSLGVGCLMFLYGCSISYWCHRLKFSSKPKNK